MLIDRLLKMSELMLANRRVLIREDLNVPMNDKGKITDDTRIQRALPTLRLALQANAAVIVLSHLGRPSEGYYDNQYSLKPVAKALSKALGQDVVFVEDWLDGVDVAPGKIVLCENVRFNVGEKANDEALAKRITKLCDVFVMDAFATAHRAQVSTVGVAQHAPIACAGPLLIEELDALSAALDEPKQPLIAVVGGSKVSSKIRLLEHLLNKVDGLIVGGGIANTFLAAQGHHIGQSLYEKDYIEETKSLIRTAEERGIALPLPVDVAVATEFSEHATATDKDISAVLDNEMILDIGPNTIPIYAKLIDQASTIVWNGPLGVFEFPAFSKGTHALGQAIAKSSAYSLAGGGDTVAALSQFGISGNISYVCTAGGAFLSYLEGTPLPAVEILIERAQQHV